MDGVLSDITEKVHAACGLHTQRIKMKREARGIVSSQTKGPFKALAAFCVMSLGELIFSAFKLCVYILDTFCIHTFQYKNSRNVT